MKTALTIYTFFCLFCPAWINYQEEQEEVIEQETIQPEWLCDCGAVKHWKDEPLGEW
jgi:hypothetical protein